MSLHFQLVSSTLHPLLLAASTGKATTSTKSTGGSQYTLLILVGLFAIVYFGFLRPRSQRAKQQQQLARKAEIGDEVMLTSGIIGRVTWYEGNRARVEIAPNTEILIDKAAILRTVQPLTDDDVAVHADNEDDSHLGDNPYTDADDEAPLGGPPMVKPAQPAESTGPTDPDPDGHDSPSETEEGHTP